MSAQKYPSIVWNWIFLTTTKRYHNQFCEITLSVEMPAEKDYPIGFLLNNQKVIKTDIQKIGWKGERQRQIFGKGDVFN